MISQPTSANFACTLFLFVADYLLDSLLSAFRAQRFDDNLSIQVRLSNVHARVDGYSLSAVANVR